MCGYVVIISKGSRKVDKQSIIKMNDMITHRGPDDEGIYCNDWLGLGFRRLSIIDLSDDGHQPMFDASGRYIGVFNGEIYNYQSLRKELEADGITFSSQTDSEVLINAYAHWGERCFNKLIGMFSFVIADLVEKKLIAVRDFPGVKPLYFTEDDNYYYFSSEVKAFTKIMTLSANLNAYYEQFTFSLCLRAGNELSFSL